MPESEAPPGPERYLAERRSPAEFKIATNPAGRPSVAAMARPGCAGSNVIWIGCLPSESGIQLAPSSSLRALSVRTVRGREGSNATTCVPPSFSSGKTRDHDAPPSLVLYRPLDPTAYTMPARLGCAATTNAIRNGVETGSQLMPPSVLRKRSQWSTRYAVPGVAASKVRGASAPPLLQELFGCSSGGVYSDHVWPPSKERKCRNATEVKTWPGWKGSSTM